MSLLTFKKAASSVLMPFFWLRLKRATQKARTLDDYLDNVWKLHIRSFHIRPFQIKSEMKQFAEVVISLRPQRILEIGTARGGTLYVLCQASQPDATIMSLDLPGGRFGSGYPFWKTPLYRSFKQTGQQLHLLRGNSHDAVMRDEVERYLKGESLDFLFIDGDHTYEGVRSDFEMYAPFVKEGGLIAFHDIVHGPERKVGGVPRFWEEVKQHYPHRELVESWKQQGFGIGLLTNEEKKSTSTDEQGRG